MLRTREHKLLALVIAVVFLFIGDRFLLTPLSTQWQANSREISELEGKLTRDKALLEQETRWLASKADIRNRELPDDMATSESKVFNTISQWAEKNGLSLRSIQPKWKVDEKKQVQVLKLRITGSGSLRAVTRFLHQLETGELPLRIGFTELRSMNDRGTSIEFDAEVSSIMLLKEDA